MLTNNLLCTVLLKSFRTTFLKLQIAITLNILSNVMPHCLLCCKTFVYYITNNFIVTRCNSLRRVSLCKHKNSNFLKVVNSSGKNG